MALYSKGSPGSSLSWTSGSYSEVQVFTRILADDAGLAEEIRIRVQKVANMLRACDQDEEAPLRRFCLGLKTVSTPRRGRRTICGFGSVNLSVGYQKNWSPAKVSREQQVPKVGKPVFSAIDPGDNIPACAFQIQNLNLILLLHRTLFYATSKRTTALKENIPSTCAMTGGD